MPDHHHFALFLAATLILLFTPGPAVLFIVGRTVDQGRLAGIVSALGISIGTLVHVAAAAAGLSALLLSSATLFGFVKYLGAAYLVYIGIRTLLSGRAAVIAVAEPAPLRRLLYQGFWVNVLNPKTALFFFAFLPQFVDLSRGAVTQQIVILGLCFACMGATSDSLYALAASSVAGWLKSSPGFLKRQRYVTGSVYIGLGVATALVGGRKSG